MHRGILAAIGTILLFTAIFFPFTTPPSMFIPINVLIGIVAIFFYIPLFAKMKG